MFYGKASMFCGNVSTFCGNVSTFFDNNYEILGKYIPFLSLRYKYMKKQYRSGARRSGMLFWWIEPTTIVQTK
jgi:hypothetical protein